MQVDFVKRRLRSALDVKDINHLGQQRNRRIERNHRPDQAIRSALTIAWRPVLISCLNAAP